MGGYSFGPPAGTTTYGGAQAIVPGSGMMPMGGGVRGIGRVGPGGGAYGDPGLFSFLGKAVRGVTGIVSKLGIPGISGAAGLVSGLLAGRRGPGITPVATTMMASRFQAEQQGVPVGRRKTGLLALGQRMVPFGETGMGEGCGAGYRANKSGYYVQGGQYVEPGTVCVKRRRMNPLNPRALSKAMRRIESAKRATSVLNRITIRKKC